MSSSTSSTRLPTPAEHGTAIAAACGRHAVAGVRAVAFWAAVALPLAYVPAAYGVAPFETAGSPLVLVAVHVACFLLGHGHAAPESSD